MRNSVKLGMAALSVLAIVGCGNSGSGGSGDSGVTDLKVVYWPGPESDAFQKVVDQYNSTQGKTDKVHVDLLLFSRVGTYTKEDSMMSAKSSDADLWFAASYNIGKYSAYMNPLPSSVDTSIFIPSALSSVSVDGKPYVVPMDVSNHFLFYRKDLMDKLMTDPSWKTKYEQISKSVVGQQLEPKDPSQWDWNDYLATAAFFTKSVNGDSPTQYGTFMQMKNLIFNVMIWDDVLWGKGGNWLNSGSADLQSSAAKDALNLYQTIYKNGYTPSSSAQSEYPETNAALETGNAAFAIQWSAAYSELSDKSKDPNFYDKIGIAPVPGGKTHIHAMGVGLNKYSKHQTQGEEFLKYLAQESAMKVYAQAGGIPPVESVLNSMGDTNSELPLIAKTVKENGFSEPPMKDEQNVLEALAADLSAAWANQSSVDDALSKAQKDVSNILGK